MYCASPPSLPFLYYNCYFIRKNFQLEEAHQLKARLTRKKMSLPQVLKRAFLQT